MDYFIGSNNVENCDVQPLKKAKSNDLAGTDDMKNVDSMPSSASPTIETSSLVSEFTEEKHSDAVINVDPLPLATSPTIETLSSVSELIDNEMREAKLPEQKQANVGDMYDYLPQDYTLTDMDLGAQIVIETSLKDDVLVKMDEISVKQHQLLCLLEQSKWIDDDVMSAYISCMRDQLHLQSMDAKIYFENPFITGLLKRDANFGIDADGNFMTEIVRNNLEHEMIFLPINTNNTHWYLAVLNTKNPEIQVLDSLCWEFNRADLTKVLQGLQDHLEILESQPNLINPCWKDLQITKWDVKEELREPIQEDSSSCGLFVLKFMEYWTGDTLSHPITQEIISLFRYKLAGILLCWKSNTAATISNSQKNDDNEANPDDVIILESTDDEKKSKELCPSSVENKYNSLMSILSKRGMPELVGGLCDYIKSIDCPQTLENVWLQNSKPYPITLTLKQLQNILNDDMPLDIDCFNLFIRKVMFDDVQMAKKKRGTISKHCLDIQFWMITDVGRHPNFRKKLDVERLAASVQSWPGINYNILACESILIPTQCNGAFVLFILVKDTKAVYILDPTPIEPMYQYNPNAKYVQKLLWIAEYLPKAISKACPGTRWNENIFLWRQIIPNNIPVYYREELSGYLVSLFMTSWKGEKLHLPLLKDEAYELRKQFLGHLLTYKENESEANMPTGVQELLSLIKKKN